MKCFKIMVLPISVILFFFLCSCAGLENKPAQSEFNAGLTLFNRGQNEEAITHFTKATELDPDFGRAYLYLARSYLSLGKWREAIVPLRTAFRLSPEESRKELSGIIMDVLFQHAMDLDNDTRTQMLDLMK